MNTTRLAAYPLLFGLAVVWACGGNASRGDNRQPQSGAIGTVGRDASVCAIVPKEDVSREIGTPITDVNDTQTACEYHTADPAVYVTIRVVSGRRAEAAMQGSKVAANMFGAGEEDKNAKPPAQFGANAIYGANGSLAVLKDGVYVSVMPPMAVVRTAESPAPEFLPEDRKRAIAADLAAKVLERARR